MAKRQGWDFGPPSVEKALGSLPVIAAFCRRLGIAATTDELCPVRDVAIATHGEVIEALVANRLTSPAPLLRVEDWARSWAVPEVFGVSAEALNDDRVGRALDAIAPQLDAIVGTVGARAIASFGLDVSRLHWDMTSISLFGAFDGGAGEVNQVIGAMESLRSMAGERRFLLVGDSKLISYANLHAFFAAGTTFVAPASKDWVSAETLGAQRIDDTVEVDYVAERDAAKALADRGRYRVREDTVVVAAKRRTDPELSVRRVFVWSSARAGAAAHARAKKLDRAGDDLGRLSRGLGSRHYPHANAVAARVTQIGRDRRVGAYLRAEVGTDERSKPTLAWSFDQAALDAEAATDGWYALLTNLDPADADAAEVLRRYKGQEVVERRYGDFKGPLAVAPMFLKSNRRIAALITVICLALLVFSLVERAVRHAVAPERTMRGLYPENRPARPTGRMIFTALASMRLIPARSGAPPVVPRPNEIQLRLLGLLDVDPTAGLR